MDIPETLGPLFEDYSPSYLNPVEDTNLSAILDDLQEGTLLSLMQDENLFKDVDNDSFFLPMNTTSLNNEELSSEDIELEDFLGSDMDLNELQVGFDPSESSKSTFQQLTDVESSVEFNIGDVATADISGKVLSEGTPNTSETCLIGIVDTLASVQHDHCYTSNARQDSDSDLCLKGHRSSTASEASTDRDEGNNSDTGYDTMSASTSPGNNNSSPEHTPRPTRPTASVLGSLPPLVSNVDPVALIDARIQHFMCSHQINLTEEEKETLRAEGLPIPTTLPLTKIEEKALKSVRRKLRNKTAARDSRKRKKEQLYDLEDKVELFNTENLRLKERVESLESENRSLLSQLRKLQAVVTSATAGTGHTSTHVGACLMVVVLCFAIFFGNWTPHRMWPNQASDYTTTSVRSRSLLSVDGPQNFQSMACDWFRHIFMRDDSDDYDTADPSGHSHSWTRQLPAYGPVKQPISKPASSVTLGTFSNNNDSNQNTRQIAVKA